MRVLLILFMSLPWAGYLSAQESVGSHDQNSSDDQLLLNDNANASYANGRRGGGRHHHGRGYGWRGYGGYGYYGPGYGYGYYGGPGYDDSYAGPDEAPIQEAPVVHEVRVPVVKRIPVVRPEIEVVRKEIRRQYVPVTVKKRVIGAPIEVPDAGPAPQGVPGGPQGGPGGPQGGPGDMQQGGGQQMPNNMGGMQQGGGGQMPNNMGGMQQGGGQMPNMGGGGQQGGF